MLAAAEPARRLTPVARRVLIGSIGAAAYRIEVPSGWNGTLFLYSHGYVAPGQRQPGERWTGPQASTHWLLGNDYALAGSVVQLDRLGARRRASRTRSRCSISSPRSVGKPKRVIAWGASLGGIITAGLVQLHPDRVRSARCRCAACSRAASPRGTPSLDGAYAFKTLLAPAPSLQLVAHHRPGRRTCRLALRRLQQRRRPRPQDRARLALVAALTDLPGWFTPDPA